MITADCVWSSGLQHHVVLYLDTEVSELYANCRFRIEACTENDRLGYMNRFTMMVISQIHEI
jgi:hypothetical protein